MANTLSKYQKAAAQMAGVISPRRRKITNETSAKYTTHEQRVVVTVTIPASMLEVYSQHDEFVVVKVSRQDPSLPVALFGEVCEFGTVEIREARSHNMIGSRPDAG